MNAKTEPRNLLPRIRNSSAISDLRLRPQNRKTVLGICGIRKLDVERSERERETENDMPTTKKTSFKTRW